MKVEIYKPPDLEAAAEGEVESTKRVRVKTGTSELGTPAQIEPAERGAKRNQLLDGGR